MTYAIKEHFETLQGEGYWAGTPALFIRFAGCNMWSGYDEHRERDAQRHEAQCPRWCDTDFRKGERMDAGQIARLVADSRMPHVVFTGGEPLLQLDKTLLKAIRQLNQDVRIAIETNGSIDPHPDVRFWLDWICVSPKQEDRLIRLRKGDELKVVMPAYDPRMFDGLAAGFKHRYVSPEAATSSVGVSLIADDNMRRAAQFCLEHPAWRLSIQTHKILGLR